MRFGTPKDVARMFRCVPGLLLALARMLLWLLAIWIVLSVPLGLITIGGWLLLVPVLIGTIRLLMWWYPRRGGRRRKTVPGAKPIEAQGALRYENWPSR